MALLCLSYFIVLGTLLGIAGLLAERALPANAPRRWIWLAIMPVSAVLPIVMSLHNNAAAIEIAGFQLVSLAPASGAAPRIDRNWWDCGATYGQVTLKLWWLSVLGLLGWGVVASRRIATIVGRRQRQLTVDGLPVTLTDAMGPATVGFWRSRVVVPRWVLGLPGAQRRYVLRHEEEHRRAHDARILCVASIIATLMPWNVPLWWQLRRLRLAVEMDCDRRVVAALGDGPAYGELLLQIAQVATRSPRVQPAFLGQVGMLERRLVALVRPERPEILRRVLATLAAAALVYLVFALPHPDPANHAAAHAAHAER